MSAAEPRPMGADVSSATSEMGNRSEVDERNRATPTLLDDTDHKRVGRLFVYVGLLFLAAGGLAGMLMRAELAEPGQGFLADEYTRSFSLHVTVLAALALPALWTGLATHLVPLQIGANRLAFPRLQACALWMHLLGGGLVLVSHLMDGFTLVGPSFAEPVGMVGAASTADQLWITGGGVVALAALASAVNLLVTLVTLRSPAVRLGRLPLFSWAILATSAVSLVSIPVHLGGLVLLYVDRHFGGELFQAIGGDDIWRHTMWLFGRPEILLLTVPGLGVAAAVAVAHGRRRLLGEPAVRGGLVAVSVLSVGIWAAGTSAAASLTAPTYSAITALTALIPFALVPAFAATVALGRPRLHPSLGFVLGAVALHGLALLNAAIAALVGVTGSAWSTGYQHAGFLLPPVLLAGAAIWHWAPKIWGRRLSPAAGWMAALGLMGGGVLQAGASFLAGYQGEASRSIDGGNVALSRLAGLGAALTILAFAILALEVGRAALADPDRDLADDAWGDGDGLEWTVASPPPRRNFESLPGAVIVEAEPTPPPSAAIDQAPVGASA